MSAKQVTTTRKPVNVLFVGGYGRSGSTILDLLLNRVPGIIAVGEFRHLFGRALGDNELCSCRRPFRDCPFWGKVLDRAFPDGYDRERIQRAVRTFNTLRRVPQLRQPPRLSPALQAQAKIYGDAFTAAYRAVAEISGARVIIDSSKYPMHGLFIRSLPDIELKTMLLVRDPRAVAYSWQRHRLRPEVHWEKREMPRHGAAYSALAWNLSNRLTRLIPDDPQRLRVQRYEDFIQEPLTELEAIAAFALGRPAQLKPTIFEKQPRLPHTIAGNPVRIGSPQIAIRADNEWEKQMSFRQKALVTAMCAPQMRRLGYRWRA